MAITLINTNLDFSVCEVAYDCRGASAAAIMKLVAALRSAGVRDTDQTDENTIADAASGRRPFIRVDLACDSAAIEDGSHYRVIPLDIWLSNEPSTPTITPAMPGMVVDLSGATCDQIRAALYHARTCDEAWGKFYEGDTKIFVTRALDYIDTFGGAILRIDSDGEITLLCGFVTPLSDIPIPDHHNFNPWHVQLDDTTPASTLDKVRIKLEEDSGAEVPIHKVFDVAVFGGSIGVSPTRDVVVDYYGGDAVSF